MTIANSRVAHPSASPSRRVRLADTAPLVPPQATLTTPVASTDGAGKIAVVTLANAQLQLDVAPALGGGITRFDWRGNGAPIPIFRRCGHVTSATQPNQLACYPLLPYSNRIGGGQFRFAGRAIAVPRNRADEALPIHGDGWLASWQIADADGTRVQLTLDRSDGNPYAYRATQIYALDGPTLVVTLEVENTGRDALPFGLGLHPFLTRDADTELSAAAGGLWLSGDDWLPQRHVPAPPAWQFGVAYPLPDAIVNHAFTDWSGRSAVVWPKRRLSLAIEANTDYYVLYTPPGENFFCFEPVDHPINAMNLEGGPAAHGMTVLKRGERLTREFCFTAEQTGLHPAASP